MSYSFCSLENEVRKRDEIISQLQQRIQELEKHGLSGKLASSEIEMEEDFQMRTQSKDPSSESDDGIDEGFMVSAVSETLSYRFNSRSV